jgi:hypothetical protein
VRALPAYVRSCRLTQAWTDEGAALCSLRSRPLGPFAFSMAWNRRSLWAEYAVKTNSGSSYKVFWPL